MFDPYRRRINYLRLSVTDLCNLRCTYCMPAEGVERKAHADILTFEEFEEVARVAVELGMEKIRITGGEPLVRRGIVELVRRIGAVEGIADYAMTTNGVLLPKYAVALREAGLQRVNISLDSLDPDRYRAITRCGRVEDALAGIEAALAADFRQVKINCVVSESPDEPDARAVAAFGRERGLEVRFIRKMNMQKGEFWRVIGGDGGHCAQCNRLRVSSTGRVYPCLFSDVRFSIRELGARRALEAAVAKKPESGRHCANQFYSIGG